MRWNETIDAYCERVGPGFWAEPVNALTNVAFLIAALWLWRASRGLILAQILCIILFVIGIGSFMFHTFATRWAALADVLPILLFILTYLFAANLHFWRWPPWAAILGTLAFIPYAAALTPLFMQVPFLRISSFYWSVPVLILAYAGFLRRRHPATAQGLAIGAGILSVSLVFRSVDGGLCSHLPLGTHFMWHLLNAVMLGWMIAVYTRHMHGSAQGAGVVAPAETH
ncbi:MAG: ceramidase domain-containing protein [Rubellimicrobium sp.]|nr:ceramidase domain-containing protein [Rubellimicrobium sp.]